MIPQSSESVIAEIGYFDRSDGSPYNYMYEPPAHVASTNCHYELKKLLINNGRVSPIPHTLSANGFQLLNAPTAVKSFYDTQEISNTYYNEIQEIALEITGGRKAYVFDHLLREREPDRPALTFGRPGDGMKPAAVGRVHNDYTEVSGLRRLQLVDPDIPVGTPFSILNFWRPTEYPAYDTPLAICKPKSFPKEDWATMSIYYPKRVGEIYVGKFSLQHQWYYYPTMGTDEMLSFISYDSRLDRENRMTPHCAFTDPTSPVDAPPRKSIEIRCLVLL